MDSHSRAVLTSAKSFFRWLMRNPFDLRNLSRNVSPPSPAPSFPKCLYVCGRIFLFPGLPTRAQHFGIPWTLSCTTSPGNTSPDTRGTRCWSSWWISTRILLTSGVSCGDIGRGGPCGCIGNVICLLKGEDTGISVYFWRDLDVKFDFWYHLECRDALLSWLTLTVVRGVRVCRHICVS